MSEAPLPVAPAPHRRPAVGYAMAAGAATLWAVNGTVSKVILASGISSLRLLEMRIDGRARRASCSSCSSWRPGGCG